MKTRTGFVSNSSSTSFYILKTEVSEKQLEQLRSHKTIGIELGYYKTCKTIAECKEEGDEDFDVCEQCYLREKQDHEEIKARMEKKGKECKPFPEKQLPWCWNDPWFHWAIIEDNEHDKEYIIVRTGFYGVNQFPMLEFFKHIGVKQAQRRARSNLILKGPNGEDAPL